jgi:uncharacterized membrane protein YdjX (TVP38/TMEM64 family)
MLGTQLMRERSCNPIPPEDRKTPPILDEVIASVMRKDLLELKAFVRRHWIWTLMVLGAVASLLFYQYFPILSAKAADFYGLLTNCRNLKNLIASFETCSPLVYILIQMLQVFLAPIPGAPIEFIGGYLFGVKAGFLFSLMGLTLGSLLAFLISRIFGKWILKRVVPSRVMKKFEYLIGREGAIVSLLLFLIPGFPKDALCYILGVTPMNLGTFLIISTMGRIPGTWFATLEGAKAYGHHYKTLLLLLGLSALAILVFYYYHERIHTLVKELKKPQPQQPF